MRTTFPTFALVAVLFTTLVGCSDDEPNEPLPDVGVTDTVDEEVGETCTIVEPPVGGDQCDCEGDDYAGRVELCDRTCECEFGFWDCEETCDEPPVLELEISSALSVDEQTGNGDGQINPGEVWVVSGTVQANNAPEEGVDVTLRLSSSSIFVEVVGASELLEGLDDTPVAFALPFEVSASAGSAEATVTVEAFSDFTTDSGEVEFAIVEPAVARLVFENTAVFNSEGSPAVRINAGDVITVSTTLRNTGTLAAEGVSVSASPSATSLSRPDSRDIGIVAAGERASIDFEVTVSDAPTELSPQLTLGATSDTAETVTSVVDVNIVRAASLAVSGYTWETGTAPAAELVITVTNSSSAAVNGLEWTHRNYTSSEAECSSGNPDVPCYVSVDLGAPVGPTSIAGSSTGEVRLPLTVSETTPSEGLVILFVESLEAPNQQFSVILADVPQP